MIDLRNTCVLVRTKEENEMLLKEAKKQDITYAASIRSDVDFYEASELLRGKEMTAREFVERIADVCRYIEAGSGEVKRGGVD